MIRLPSGEDSVKNPSLCDDDDSFRDSSGGGGFSFLCLFMACFLLFLELPVPMNRWIGIVVNAPAVLREEDLREIVFNEEPIIVGLNYCSFQCSINRMMLRQTGTVPNTS